MADLSTDQLLQLCEALDWQGGTFWQVLGAIGELREASRQFHNLTQGDPEVIIRPPSAAKRDAIIAAGERLRGAIGARGSLPPNDHSAGWIDILQTIELGLKRGYTPAELLDENSPVRDRIRAAVFGVKTCEGGHPK